MTLLNLIALYFYSFIIIAKTDSQYLKTCKNNICEGSNKYMTCKFSGRSPNCIDYGKTIISREDKQLILDKINSRRNKVASGEIRSLPAAENMIRLEWNDELALSAQKWADQCRPDSVENSCRNSDITDVGQNIATIMGDSPGLRPYVLVDLWYIELLNINTSIISSYQSSSSTDLQHYDYFTQLVWSTTTAVGCGGVKFSEKEHKLRSQRRTVYRLVCNFTPSGNRQGKEVYSKGGPCSKCPENYSCDYEYPSLCSKDVDESEKYEPPSNTNISTGYLLPLMDKINNDTGTFDSAIKSFDIAIEELQTKDADSVDSFDLLSHLFLTSTTSLETIPTTPKCKDVVAVEEFIRILKNKLNSEQLVRDFLHSTATSSRDSSPSDDNVKAVVQQIYSKKIPSTTTSTTESNYMNSTLLANLVEAIIFRKNDAVSITHNPYIETPTYNNIKPIKIQASLGEVKVNNEFSGHLFFPEEDEDEKNYESEAAESFYDSTDVPVSDVAFEIEDISKNTRTRNFLDEILEEELLKEGATEDLPISRRQATGVYTAPYPGIYLRNIRRFKRNNNNSTYVIKKKGNGYVHYFDLLKVLAADLRKLKLRENHSCSSNNDDFGRKNIYLFICTGIIIIQNFS